MQPVTSTTTTTTTPVPYRKAHPIRGILWGFVMGVGAAAIAILLKIIPFDLMWALIVVAGGILIGILWSTLGPAKKPKGVPPRPTEVVTHRPDWDSSPASPTSPVPPVEPAAPDVEPLHIQPLDVEPLDIASPADAPVETLPDPAEPVGEPLPEPQRAMEPPERTDPPAPTPPPPPPPPPPG
jgi:hypothetical protein